MIYELAAGPLSVDVVFPLAVEALPRDHAQSLQQALSQRLPWLDNEALAGIHPLKLVPGSSELALLSRRTRLLLRVSAARVDELRLLDGFELELGGHRLLLGPPHVRELLAHSTLYAPRVAAQSVDEVAFMASIELELAALSIGAQRVCGKRHSIALGARQLHTFSLMLHGLSPAQSLRLQRHGLGQHRLLGCGVFVPHKSAAAV